MGEAPATRPSLLIRLRDPRDEGAWAEFVEIYGPPVQRLARHNGMQDADAADLTQEVFRVVARAVGRWDTDPAAGSFRGWLFKVARNRIIDFLADQRRQPRGSGDTGVELLLRNQVDASAEQTEWFEAECRRRLFAWAIEQIRGEFSEPTWLAFWRTGVEGRPAKEVARSLAMTPGAVYRCKSRVMARLRQKIEETEGGARADDAAATP